MQLVLYDPSRRYIEGSNDCILLGFPDLESPPPTPPPRIAAKVASPPATPILRRSARNQKRPAEIVKLPETNKRRKVRFGLPDATLQKVNTMAETRSDDPFSSPESKTSPKSSDDSAKASDRASSKGSSNKAVSPKPAVLDYYGNPIVKKSVMGYEGSSLVGETIIPREPWNCDHRIRLVHYTGLGYRREALREYEQYCRLCLASFSESSKTYWFIAQIDHVATLLDENIEGDIPGLPPPGYDWLAPVVGSANLARVHVSPATYDVAEYKEARRAERHEMRQKRKKQRVQPVDTNVVE